MIEAQKCALLDSEVHLQDAAGLRHVSESTYRDGIADTFLLRGTTEHLEAYNRLAPLASVTH